MNGGHLVAREIAAHTGGKRRMQLFGRVSGHPAMGAQPLGDLVRKDRRGDLAFERSDPDPADSGGAFRVGKRGDEVAGEVAVLAFDEDERGGKGGGRKRAAREHNRLPARKRKGKRHGYHTPLAKRACTWSARRSASATTVSVGLTVDDVVKTELPAT